MDAVVAKTEDGGITIIGGGSYKNYFMIFMHDISGINTLPAHFDNKTLIV